MLFADHVHPAERGFWAFVLEVLDSGFWLEGEVVAEFEEVVNFCRHKKAPLILGASLSWGFLISQDCSGATGNGGEPSYYQSD